MSNNEHSLRHFAALTNSGEFSKVTMETEYGLIIEVGPGKSIQAKLRDDVVMSQEPANKLGYKYSIFTDWGTDYLWYDRDWPGNPYQTGENVSTEELMEEQGPDVRDTALQAWAKAWQKWYDIYDIGFDENLNKPGDFSKDPIPDKKERQGWATQGMLLAVWLSLLPSVASVKYNPGVHRVMFDAKAEGEDSTAEIMARMLKDMDSYYGPENIDKPED